MSTAFRFDPVELPPECEALRAEVREFIAGDLAAGHWVPNSDFGSHRSAVFSRRLGARGWIGMTWPKRYGGGERSMLERYVVTEELLAAGAPVGVHWIADRQSGPLLLRYGTEEQRLKFLPGIARGETFFCIGMSEPDLGSDLASIRTRAAAVAGGYEVTGAKVWTSYAHESHFAITLVRTAPAENDRHRGLSQLILDLKSPGVTIRPIINLAGEHDFNEILLHRRLRPGRPAGRDGRRRLAAGDERARLRAQRARTLHQLLSAAYRADPPRRPRSGAAGRGGGRAHDRASVDPAANVAVDRGHAAGRRDPQLEAALVKDLGNAFEREVPELVRLLAPGRRRAAEDRFEEVLAEAVPHAPSWTCAAHPRDPARHHPPRPRPALTPDRLGARFGGYCAAARCSANSASHGPGKRPRPLSVAKIRS